MNMGSPWNYNPIYDSSPRISYPAHKVSSFASYLDNKLPCKSEVDLESSSSYQIDSNNVDLEAPVEFITNFYFKVNKELILAHQSFKEKFSSNHSSPVKPNKNEEKDEVSKFNCKLERKKEHEVSLDSKSTKVKIEKDSVVEEEIPKIFVSQPAEDLKRKMSFGNSTATFEKEREEAKNISEVNEEEKVNKKAIRKAKRKESKLEWSEESESLFEEKPKRKRSIKANRKKSEVPSISQSKRKKSEVSLISQPKSSGKKGDLLPCPFCDKFFCSTGLGGHKAKAHPGMNLDYKRKLIVRNKNAKKLKLLRLAQEMYRRKEGDYTIKNSEMHRGLIEKYKKEWMDQISSSNSDS